MNTERRTITQPADWWEAFEQRAEQANCSLSEWMGKCCLIALPQQICSKLSERPPAHRPKKE